MKNTHKKHEIVSERVFEGNLTNKINLERMKKIKVEFQRLDIIN